MDLISVHIPKTAGTSFRVLLENVYGADVLQDYPDRYENLLCPFNDLSKPREELISLLGSKRVVHGHFHQDKYKGINAKRIVWLRNPLSRVISHYYYLKTVPHNSAYRNNGLRDMIFNENLSLLQFAALPFVANLYTKHYISNLDEFAFVGITEFFEEDLQDLTRFMGWGRVSPVYVNETAHPSYKRTIDLGVMEQLCFLNLEDYTLYRKAIQMRTLRRSAHG